MQKIAFKILMAAQWVKLGQVDITIRKHQRIVIVELKLCGHQ